MIIGFSVLPYVFGILLILYHLLPYVKNKSQRGLPGPSLAAISNLWLLYQCRRGRRSLVVDDVHKKYGKLVRLQPNHVSVADVDAIAVIYSHHGGWTKSEYYDAFVSIRRGLFNTRSRAEHTRKRKAISHTFSAKSIAEFEPYITKNLQVLLKQFDCICDQSLDDGYAFANIDCLPWFNYLAFDIIGDLAFGVPFDMLKHGEDRAEVQIVPGGPITSAPAVQVLNRRGEVSATLGCMPFLKPWAKYLPDPFFRNGIAAVENLAGIAVARVSARLKFSEDGLSGQCSSRKDILARLMEAKDDQGNTLAREELTAEALTQLIAGSDTTSNTSCAALYWISKTHGVMARMQEELDNAIPSNVKVPSYDAVKHLPYLHNVIKETLRIHSTSSLGLPRVVPARAIGDRTSSTNQRDGVTISGHHFPPGTVLSVPTYTIHHDPDIWGSDVEEFDPDRWLPSRLTARQASAFIPFSQGPRACVGRNVAEMELAMIFATIMRRYSFINQESGPLMTREGFLRKPIQCRVSIKQRTS